MSLYPHIPGAHIIHYGDFGVEDRVFNYDSEDWVLFLALLPHPSNSLSLGLYLFLKLECYKLFFSVNRL